MISRRTLVILLALCVLATANAQLKYRHKVRDPASRITFLQANERQGEPPLNIKDLGEITKKMAEVEKAKDMISSQLREVHDSISKEEQKIEKQHELKKEMEKRKRLRAGNAAEEKHKLAEAAMLKISKARLRINNCLSQIKGGANKVYWKLRNLFARAEPERACTLLKNYEFPSLPRNGYTERIYKSYGIGPEQNMDGTEVTSFDAIKLPLFKCICTVDVVHKPKFNLIDREKVLRQQEEAEKKEKIEEEKQKKAVLEQQKLAEEDKKLQRKKEEEEEVKALEAKKAKAVDTVEYSQVDKDSKMKADAISNNSDATEEGKAIGDMDKMEEESKGKAHQEDEALKSDSRIQ